MAVLQVGKHADAGVARSPAEDKVLRARLEHQIHLGARRNNAISSPAQTLPYLTSWCVALTDIEMGASTLGYNDHGHRPGVQAPILLCYACLKATCFPHKASSSHGLCFLYFGFLDVEY